nr:EOG090X0IQO [Sida crystallina]
MPSYELSLIIRTLTQPALISTIKRTAETILENGGILRQFVSLGTNPLPYRIRSTNGWHRDGTYFVIKFDAPPSAMEQVTDAVKRDIDIIRPAVFKMEKQSLPGCMLEEELKPPAYRKDVEELIKEGRKIKEPLFKRNIPGINHNPFQK